MPTPTPRGLGLAAYDDVARLTKFSLPLTQRRVITTAGLREATRPGGPLSPCSPISQMERVRSHTCRRGQGLARPTCSPKLPLTSQLCWGSAPSDSSQKGQWHWVFAPQITRLTALLGQNQWSTGVQPLRGQGRRVSFTPSRANRS